MKTPWLRGSAAGSGNWLSTSAGARNAYQAVSRCRAMTDRIDRYVRGELTAGEARQLAQESLDSPELFEDLAFSALAKSALFAGPLPESKIVRFPRKARFVAVGATAAAAAVLVSLYLPPNQP